MPPPKGVSLRWPRLGDRVLLVGKHPFAGQEALVVRMEAPWGIAKLFGRFPRVRTDSGREEYLINKREWRVILTEEQRERRRIVEQQASAKWRAARRAANG